MKELSKPEEYYPYISHHLNIGVLEHYKLWETVIGGVFNNPRYGKNNDECVLVNNSNIGIFNKIIIKGLNRQRELAGDPNSSQIIMPRHRSLYDYTIGMPIHYALINNNIMLLAGDNLFVSSYAKILREYGAVMFLRKDKILKKKGLPPAFLSQKRYMNEVFPGYVKWQMLDGVGPEKSKHDFIIYAGQEKHPVTKVRSGGRTKTGKLRKLNPIFFEKFKAITRGHPTRFYITPMNISFSQYPDAPFIVHPFHLKGIWRAFMYLREQNYMFKTFTKYARRNREATLDVIVNYGEPMLFSGDTINTMHDVIHFASRVREEIGKLESLFPSTFLLSVLDDKTDLHLDTLEEKAKRHYDHYLKNNINVEMISENRESMMPIRDIIERAMRNMNNNPSYPVHRIRKKPFLSFRNNRLISHDLKVQKWYANNVLHLHGEEEDEN